MAVYNGTSANEYIPGSSGDDSLRGNGGADFILGYGGNDYLSGEEDMYSGWNDTIYGGDGNDTI